LGEPKPCHTLGRMADPDLGALRDATQRIVDLANQLEGHFDGSATLSDDVLSQLLSDAGDAEVLWREAFRVSVTEGRSQPG